MSYNEIERNNRHATRRLFATAFALCMPIVMALLLSGGLFKLGTLAPGEVKSAHAAGMDHGQAPSQIYDVSVTGSAFIPASITINPGDGIRWTNNSNDRARIRDAQHNYFDSDDLEPGQSFTYIFTFSGTITVVEERNDFTGTVIVTGNVTPPPSTGTAGTGTPQTTGTTTPGTPFPTGTAGTVIVNIVGEDFPGYDPANITVQSGTTVRWVNVSDDEHTVTSPGAFDSGEIERGGTYQTTLIVNGTYNYFCLFHEDMAGSVTVIGGPTATTAPTSTPNPGNATVNIQGSTFQPQIVNILPGASVTWTNNDPYAHTATSPGNFDSGNLNQGQSYTHVFNTAGSYSYFCALHPGMTGSINVGTGGGGTPSPGTGTPNTTQTAVPSTTSGPTNTPVAGNASVNIQNFVFTPQHLTVNVGTTVTWTNNDPYAHTATSPGNFDSGNLNQGQTYSFTFNTPGTYNYFCALHPSMTGSITVSNGGGGTPTSQPSGTAQTTGTPNTTVQPTNTSLPTATRVPGLFTVDIRNYQYSPLTVTVRLGDTVRWTNFDADLHSVTDKAVPPRFDSGPMAQNAQFSYTFTQPGTYEYVCEYHNPFMTAWVVVLPNDTGCSNGFSDVQPGSTFYNNIMCLTNAGIISGYNDCTFRPNADVTRGQLSKIIANAAGFNDPVSGQSFEDVPPTHTFYQFIERMAARGIIGGYDCGGPGEPCGTQNRPYFRANANATRGQISKIVANAANLNDDPGPQRFTDVAPGSTFYNFIQRLSARGVMGGYACGGPGEPCGPTNMPYFRPGNNATRGQTSKITANTFFPSCTP